MLLDTLERVLPQPLGKAEALPFEAYRDPDYFRLEQREVFGRDWVFVCMDADLPRVGDYRALTLGDEPLVVLRGTDGKLRALSNVCRHRGAVMLKGSGNARKITCPYHAWTYSDEGALLGVPYPGDVGVDKPAHGLPRFGLESWIGFVFVSLDPQAPPLAERFRGLETYLTRYQVEDFRHTHPIETWSWQANWKLAIENFVEGYHFFAVHPTTVETAARTRDCFYVEGGADWSITGGRQLDYPTTWKDWILGRSQVVPYLSIHLPPNLVCNLYPGSMGWARVLPTGPTTCEVASGFCSHHPTPVAKGLKAHYAKTLGEDRAICESVQRGVASPRSRGGQLVEMERAVVDFHHYLGKRLFGEAPCGPHRTEHAERFSGTAGGDALAPSP